MSPRKTPNGHHQQLFHCEETDHPTDFCAVSAPKKPTISIDAIAIALMATKMDVVPSEVSIQPTTIGINNKTAYAHRSSIYAKLKLASDHELRMLAKRRGLVAAS